MTEFKSDHWGLGVTDVAPQELLSAVVEMSDDAIIFCDAEGKITSWSEIAERLFGTVADDVLYEHFEVLFPKHFRGEVRDVIAAVMAGDRITHFETEILRPDGLPLPMSLSMCPVINSADQLVGSVVIVRDVTEQHLTQATLAEVETRLEEGEALAHVGSWLWDLRTGAVQWSAEFHRINGVDPFAFDGTFESHLARVHPDDQDALRAALEDSVASGRAFEGEYRVIRPDGALRVVYVRTQPTIGSSGDAVGLRGIGQDITERAVSDFNRGQPEA